MPDMSLFIANAQCRQTASACPFFWGLHALRVKQFRHRRLAGRTAKSEIRRSMTKSKTRISASAGGGGEDGVYLRAIGDSTVIAFIVSPYICDRGIGEGKGLLQLHEGTRSAKGDEQLT